MEAVIVTVAVDVTVCDAVVVPVGVSVAENEFVPRIVPVRVEDWVLVTVGVAEDEGVTVPIRVPCAEDVPEGV